VLDYSNEYSHWQAARSLGEWLQEEKVRDPRITAFREQTCVSGTRERTSGIELVVTYLLRCLHCSVLGLISVP